MRKAMGEAMAGGWLHRGAAAVQSSQVTKLAWKERKQGCTWLPLDTGDAFKIPSASILGPEPIGTGDGEAFASTINFADRS
jgi:hypothetical protein